MKKEKEDIFPLVAVMVAERVLLNAIKGDITPDELDRKIKRKAWDKVKKELDLDDNGKVIKRD